MEKTPFFKTDCPSCGAPVEAYSATAVTLVCGHCHSMLVVRKGKKKSGSIVSYTERDSALLEDFSPLQIGTRGVFVHRNFTLIGRLQVHYDVGVWNEWYALFDDGLTGWLSEVGDLYAMTCEASGKAKGLPTTFESVRLGQSFFELDGKTFVVSDARTIHYRNTDAQGELPFNLTAKKATGKVCDFRCGKLFLTIDFTVSPLTIYLGRVVSLNSLKLENLRSDDEIQASAGRLKGEIHTEACPNCGASVHWPSGVTSFLLCSSCGSSLKTTKDTVELMKENTARQEQQNLFTLKIGTVGRLNDTEYRVIGAVQYAEIPFGSITRNYVVKEERFGKWTEYLLYNTQQGFAWLVESGNSWRFSETLQAWPEFDINGNPVDEKVVDRYGGRVETAAGAFYWCIKSGDVIDYTEYRSATDYSDNSRLCVEQGKDETVWSRSKPIPYSQMRKAFDLPRDSVGAFGLWLTNEERRPEDRDDRIRACATVILIVINLPAWLSPDLLSFEGIGVSLFALVWIWIAERFKDDDDYEEERGIMILGFFFLIFIATLFNYFLVAEGDSSYSGSGYSGYSGGHK